MGIKGIDKDKDGDPDTVPYQLAVAAAASFIGSFLYSVFIQELLQKCHTYDKYNLFLYSVLYFVIAGFILYFIVLDEPTFWTPFMLYSGMFIQGLGMANIMNTSVSLVSEMIGQDDESSAIVFASFNIIESFTNGGVIYILNAYHFVNDSYSMKITLSLIPTICALGAYVISWLRFRRRAI